MSFFDPPARSGAQPVRKNKTPGFHTENETVKHFLNTYKQPVHKHPIGVEYEYGKTKCVPDVWNIFTSDDGSTVFVINKDGKDEALRNAVQVNRYLQDNYNEVMNIFFAAHNATRTIKNTIPAEKVDAHATEEFSNPLSNKTYVHGITDRAKAENSWLEYSFKDRDSTNVFENKMWVSPDAELPLEKRFFIGFNELLSYFQMRDNASYL